MGSLCAASPIASLAVASSTPAISNMMRPGFTTETHFSGAPLPLPMRVSAGFLVNGLSGKMRIHDLPVGDPCGFHSFQTVFAEGQGAAAPRFAGTPAAHLLPIFHFLGHQHRCVLASLDLVR